MLLAVWGRFVYSPDIPAKLGYVYFFHFETASLSLSSSSFYMQVRPILNYGAEVWGLNGNVFIVIKKVHTCTMKIFLGIPNKMVSGDFKSYSLFPNMYTGCLRYWIQVTKMEQQTLSWRAYKMLARLDSNGKQTLVCELRLVLVRYGEHGQWKLFY